MPNLAHAVHPSPLRYPGGKGKVANFFKLLLLQNNLVGGTYVEIYAGGASVALTLLYEEYADHIYINDINRGIFAFWNSTLNHTEEFCRRIKDTPVTMEEWVRQRAVQRSVDPDPLDLAFAVFFLNRSNRSGIIDAGVIGGNAQTGNWKIDARYYKDRLIKRIEKVARYRNRITLTCYDAAQYLRVLVPQLPVNTLLYLDPPYYVKGHHLYENSYRHENHEEIASLVNEIKLPWVISYDSSPNIEHLYAKYPSVKYNLNYSAANKYKGLEVMFFSSNIKCPDVLSPAKVSETMVTDTRNSVLHVSRLI